MDITFIVTDLQYNQNAKCNFIYFDLRCIIEFLLLNTFFSNIKNVHIIVMSLTDLSFVNCGTYPLCSRYLWCFLRTHGSMWQRRRQLAKNPGICPLSTLHQKDLRPSFSPQTQGRSWRIGWKPSTSTSMIRVSFFNLRLNKNNYGFHNTPGHVRVLI